MAIKRIVSNRNSIVVKKLREQKLRAGLPFMINVDELSSNQCYLEYPNGIIKLVSVVPTSRDINVIKELSPFEANNLRKRLKFSN
ncbi:hypothetical protein [Flavobacterium aurantiibacter]|uniref:Uncharacterized protein n=1 Tax=Flavobacterium aurantiibacter TaxID=2023067 RepID=A0A255ZTM6_9FLAO|nr:hypothetical protein [Flavobacterium aurantiibacter]OYQ44786.1 hypothetical protein CHX27_07155 [Flavobacterium aurantiibacter]